MSCNCSCKGKCSCSKVAWVLVLVGGLNWGLVGLGMLMNSNWNLVSLIFGSWPTVEAVVYLGCFALKCMANYAILALLYGDCIYDYFLYFRLSRCLRAGFFPYYLSRKKKKDSKAFYGSRA